MSLWIKDATSRAPLTVYHRAVPSPEGLVRIVYNPDDGGVVALVHNQINGGAVTPVALEALLHASGGLSGD